MKALKNENLKELTEKVLDLVAKTSVEIGHKTEPQTMASLSKIFAQDLIQVKLFGNLITSLMPIEGVKYLIGSSKEYLEWDLCNGASSSNSLSLPAFLYLFILP